MNSLKSLTLESVYRTENHNLYQDFYKPVLNCALQYDRAVGFFSSAILSSSLQSLSNLIRNNGTIRLIIGHPLDAEEYNAIKNAGEKKYEEIADEYMGQLLEMIQNEKTKNHRLVLLGYLIATNKLEIKYALRRKGMYHEKIGIVHDYEKNVIVFQGSANETPSAFFEDINSECISVYKSWEEDIFNKYGLEYINAFENLWENKNKNTIVINVLSKQYEKIKDYINNEYILDNPPLELEELFNALDEETEKQINTPLNIPSIPQYLGLNKFSIRDHQKNALNKWRANGFIGILKHATGSGKTITALYALTKIFEAKNKNKQPLCVVISVPYIDLANQWAKELNIFNISPIKCYEGKNNWFEKLKNHIFLFKHNKQPFLCILVVNKTLISEDFQALITQIPKQHLLLIGDECHRHGSLNTRLALPEAKFRLGLSATPFTDDDDEIDSPFRNESKINLLDYYNDIVDEYSLEDAINDGILTHYNYYIIPCHLTSDEQDIYDELSYEIGKIVSQANKKLTKNESDRLMIFSSKRSRLLGSAINKISALETLIQNTNEEDRKLSLIYVGEGTNNNNETIVNEVSRTLRKQNWKTAQFISDTPKSERKKFLEMFKNQDIDALIAMKVLDEGIDVPACKNAYILASTKNPRQYVQRRGRVLRKYPGKNIANIFDFVILPSSDTNSTYANTLKSSELERIRDFCLLATNKVDIETMIDQLELNNG